MSNKSAKQILDSLKNDLEYYNDFIKEVSEDILNNKISNYPIFIASQYDIKLGEIILDRKDFNKNWSIYSTVAEEMIKKKLILKDKFEDFKKIYKDPRKFICVFLISEKGANFIFVPFKN